MSRLTTKQRRARSRGRADVVFSAHRYAAGHVVERVSKEIALAEVRIRARDTEFWLYGNLAEALKVWL